MSVRCSSLRCFSALVFVGCFFLSFQTVSAAEGGVAIRAGLSRIEITPPIGGQPWGYAGADTTDGVHDSLYATALLLESQDARVALVTWDVCEFQSARLQKEVRENGFTHLLLCCSHTHAGPNLYQKDFPQKGETWLDTVEERTLAAIKKASENMFPAYFAVGEGNIQLGYNRLVRGPDGLNITHFNNKERIPYGPVDPTVGVIRIEDDTGAVRAVVVHYACHPVVLGPKNRKISADYVGAMRKRVENEFGDGVYCLFLQGCGGDINPLFMARTGNPDEDFPLVETMGEILADEVLETLETMKSTAARSENLKARSDTITTNHRWEKEKELTFGVTSLLINGTLGLVTIPGEPFIYYQKYLRERAELPNVYLVGYTDNTIQDWPNYYFPDIVSAAHAGYGASDATIAGLGAGEMLVNRGLIQLFSMRGMYRDEPWRPPSR